MASAESALRTSVADLSAVQARWALIGGLAVSARTIPRFTKDLDFAIAVASDGEAEEVVHRLRSRGYFPVEILEQDYVERLSGVRLGSSSDVLVDLLFASSGIENEVVAGADRLEVLPRLTVPVATTPHLIALKILAGRSQLGTQTPGFGGCLRARPRHRARAPLDPRAANAGHIDVARMSSRSPR